MTYQTLLRSGASAIALGLYFAAMPVTIDLSPDDGLVGLAASQAFAKDGGDDRGDDSGGRDDNDDDHSGSGGGSDDRDDDDRSGSGGGGDDDDDDRSGSGGGGGDDDNDDRSGSGGDDDGDDDNDNDDRSGRGGGDDDRSGRGGDDDDDSDDRRGRGSDDGLAGGGATVGGGGTGGLHVVKVEQSGSEIEIVYSNGIKEELEGNRYELKNAAGRTVVERTATAADRTRMQRNVRTSGVPTTPGVVAATRSAPRVPAGSQVRRVEVGTRTIEVSYSSGWREEIERNRYELKDPNNNTVVERRATQSDVDRLMALAR